MTALSTSAFKYNFAAKEVFCYWSNPSEKLLRVPFICLCKPQPLPTKIFSGRSLISFDRFWLSKARDTTLDHIRLGARGTHEFALHDVRAFTSSCVSQL